MPTYAERLAAASLPVRTVSLCLRGDLVAEVQAAEEDLQRSRERAETMSDRAETRSIAERIEALRAEMLDATVVYRLRGLSNSAWHALVIEHEPRNGNVNDQQLGYNTDTFFPALVRACVVEPDLDDETWGQTVEVLSFGQFDDLVAAALAVSRYRVDIPFSPAASAILRTSGETSEQPAS